MSGTRNPSRLDRNLREKHRRLQLKDLFAWLASLLPERPSRITVSETIDRAIGYIGQCQERIMMLQRRLEQVRRKGDKKLPEFSVSSCGSEVEVNFRVSEFYKSMNLHKVIHAIEEEGAEVISVSYSAVDGQVLGSIRSKAISTRIGIEISNVRKRLKQLSF